MPTVTDKQHHALYVLINILCASVIYFHFFGVVNQVNSRERCIVTLGTNEICWSVIFLDCLQLKSSSDMGAQPVLVR